MLNVEDSTLTSELLHSHQPLVSVVCGNSSEVKGGEM